MTPKAILDFFQNHLSFWNHDVFPKRAKHSITSVFPLWTQCNTLQHTATQCQTLQQNTLWHTVTHCNSLQSKHNHATHRTPLWAKYTHCNTLQHIATHRNTLQHTATHYNTLQHTDITNILSITNPDFSKEKTISRFWGAAITESQKIKYQAPSPSLSNPPPPLSASHSLSLSLSFSLLLCVFKGQVHHQDCLFGTRQFAHLS